MSCKAKGAVVKYIQVDVVDVYNSSGTKVVTFKYDAYGNCTESGDNVLAQYSINTRNCGNLRIVLR